MMFDPQEYHKTLEAAEDGYELAKLISDTPYDNWVLYGKWLYSRITVPASEDEYLDNMAALYWECTLAVM